MFWGEKKRSLCRRGGGGRRGRKRSREGSIIVVIVLIVVSAWRRQGMCLCCISFLDGPCLLQGPDTKQGTPWWGDFAIPKFWSLFWLWLVCPLSLTIQQMWPQSSNSIICFALKSKVKKKKKSVREIKIKKKKIQSTLSISTSILEICLLGSSKAKAQAHYKTITLVYRPNRNAHTWSRKGMHEKVLSSTMHNRQTVEITQMSINTHNKIPSRKIMNNQQPVKMM